MGVFIVTSLFFASLATVIPVPIPLDVFLLGALKLHINPFVIVTITTIGVFIAAAVDYSIGRFSLKVFPILRKNHKNNRFKKAKRIYKKFGEWTLLFSFIPFIGSYFSFLAGVMELNFNRFVVIYLSGRIIYYAVILVILKFLRYI